MKMKRPKGTIPGRVSRSALALAQHGGRRAPVIRQPGAEARVAPAVPHRRGTQRRESPGGAMPSNKVLHALAFACGLEPWAVKASLQKSAANFRDVDSDPEPLTFEARQSTDLGATWGAWGNAAQKSERLNATDGEKTQFRPFDTAIDRWCPGISVVVDGAGENDSAAAIVTVSGLGPKDEEYLVASGQPLYIEVEDWLTASVVVDVEAEQATDANPVDVYVSAMGGLPHSFE